jgi:hypothetical protein
VLRKTKLKKLQVGDAVVFEGDAFILGDGPWMGTVLEKRGTERLNPHTGRWRNAVKVFVRLSSAQDGSTHDQWVWDTDWEVRPWRLLSRAK